MMVVLLVIVSLAVCDCEEARLELRDGGSLRYTASETETNTLFGKGRGAEVFQKIQRDLCRDHRWR